MKHCTGYGDCKQGRAKCKTPLTCSGMPADEAIARLNRQLPPPVRKSEPVKAFPLALSLVGWIAVPMVLCALLWALALNN